MPDGKHIIYNSYNGNKQLTKLTDYFGNTTSYTYDAWGRLTGYSDSLGKTASYGYYSDGLRSQKTVDNTTIKYYYNGSDVINETKNGVNFATNVMGVDGPISRQYSGYEHYFYKNIHGDVIFAFTSNHWRSSEYSYDVYGNGKISYDYFSANPNPIRYSGQYYDTESGMTYLRARYYDPYQRRFISEDPAKDGVNWYAYCGNNPVMFVDPWGLKERYLSDLVAETTGKIVWEADYNRAKVTIDGRTKYYYINENNIVNDKIMVDDNDFYRDFDIIGEITIASCWTADNPGEFSSINSQLISGHALIYYEEYDSDLIVTYSAWNNDESIYNRPKDRDYLNDSNTSTYTKKITRNQRYRMSEYIQDRTHSVWKPYNTCANFAQNTFYVTTGILLGNTPFPKDLKNNIDRKNAGRMIVIW